jgi:hypothetical protein
MKKSSESMCVPVLFSCAVTPLDRILTNDEGGCQTMLKKRTSKTTILVQIFGTYGTSVEMKTS